MGLAWQAALVEKPRQEGKLLVTPRTREQPQPMARRKRELQGRSHEDISSANMTSSEGASSPVEPAGENTIQLTPLV